MTTDARHARAIGKLEQWLDESTAGDGPIILGPWLGEVGWELLYWIPLLRWVARERPELRSRLVALSRGGVASWYIGVTEQYLEIFDLMDPDEMARLRGAEHGRARALWGRQPMVSELEQAILERARARLGTDSPCNLHPWAATWIGTTLTKLADTGFPQPLESMLVVDRVRPPPLPPEIELPPRFTAVRLYRGVALEGPGTREAVRRTAGLVSKLGPIVLLDPGLSLDEHWDYDLGVRGVTRLPELEPSENLAVQTAVLARADLFVGTYGGLSYLAPLLGVPAVTLMNNRDRLSFKAPPSELRGSRPPSLGEMILTHARRVFASPVFPEYHVVSDEDPLVLGALSAATHGLQTGRHARMKSGSWLARAARILRSQRSAT